MEFVRAIKNYLLPSGRFVKSGSILRVDNDSSQIPPYVHVRGDVYDRVEERVYQDYSFYIEKDCVKEL